MQNRTKSWVPNRKRKATDGEGEAGEDKKQKGDDDDGGEGGEKKKEEPVTKMTELDDEGDADELMSPGVARGRGRGRGRNGGVGATFTPVLAASKLGRSRGRGRASSRRSPGAQAPSTGTTS